MCGGGGERGTDFLLQTRRGGEKGRKGGGRSPFTKNRGRLVWPSWPSFLLVKKLPMVYDASNVAFRSAFHQYIFHWSTRNSLVTGQANITVVLLSDNFKNPFLDVPTESYKQRKMRCNLC